MNIPLILCPVCQRHIRVREVDCPFCGATLDERSRAGAQQFTPTKRLGSLALMAFRTTALGAAIAACGGTDTDGARDSGSEVGAGGTSAGMGGSPNGNLGGAPNDNEGGNTGQGGNPGTGGGIQLSGTGGAFPPPFDGGGVPIYRATPRGN